MTDKLVALTGATGFIGARLRQRLIADGWQVRALSRRPADQADDGVTWYRGDLITGEGVEALVDDADAVVHCAGTVSAATDAAFHQGNVEATRTVVEATARQDKRPRLIVLSSLAARYPGLSSYARSKRLAEDVVTTHAGNTPWTILRPTAVYGPGDRALVPIFRSLARGWLVVPGAWAARISLLHVDDLVNAIAVGLTAKGSPWGCFELDDGTDGGYTWWTIAASAEQAFERRVRLLPIPASMLYLAGAVNQGLARLLGYAPTLTPGKVRELRHDDWRCDYRPYRELTGWWPRLGLTDAMSRGLLGIEGNTD